MKKYAVLMCVLALCGCMPKPKQTAFYALPSSSVDAVSDMRAGIDVGRIKIPEYIDRSQIVTLSDVNVNVDQHNRWAEGLGTMIQRRLISDIGRALPKSTVKDGNFMATGGDYAVFVEIYNLDGELGGDARLVAIYSIMGDGGAAVKTGNVSYRVPAGDDYAAYATAVGKLVDKLSIDIARALSHAAE